MATSYATYEEYVTGSGDERTPEARVTGKLEELSAELRAECGITDTGALPGDAGVLARKLVVDAARRALVMPSIDGIDGDLTGVRQASFSANGFSQSITVSTGSAWFDTRSLSRLKRLLGRGQRMGFVYPYGR
jgi:hypothetical protein